MADPLLDYVVNEGTIARTVPVLTKDGKPKFDRDGNPVEAPKYFQPGEKLKLTEEEASQYDPFFLLPADVWAKKQRLAALQTEVDAATATTPAAE